MIEKEFETQIEPIIVSKSYRHKGIGKQLVSRVIEEAQKKELRHLNVSPVARNKNTIAFFHKLGFVNLGYVELFIDFTGQTWKPGFRMHDLDFDY